MKQSLSYAEKEREIDLKEREAIVYRAESLQREFEHVNKLLQVCLFLNRTSDRTFKCSKFFKTYSVEFQTEINWNYLEHENYRRCSVTLHHIDKIGTCNSASHFCFSR